MSSKSSDSFSTFIIFTGTLANVPLLPLLPHPLCCPGTARGLDHPLTWLGWWCCRVVDPSHLGQGAPYVCNDPHHTALNKDMLPLVSTDPVCLFPGLTTGLGLHWRALLYFYTYLPGLHPSPPSLSTSPLRPPPPNRAPSPPSLPLSGLTIPSHHPLPPSPQGSPGT